MDRVLERFSKKYKIDSDTGCWLWTAYIRTSGYGHFSSKEHKENYAHRFSYKFFVGNIDIDQYVLHKCDNKVCVNPEHLFLDTQDQNMKDMIGKGRQCKGEKTFSAKLTEEQVLYIRSMSNYKGLTKELAKKFGVTHSTISEVRSRKRWRHLK